MDVQVICCGDTLRSSHGHNPEWTLFRADIIQSGHNAERTLFSADIESTDRGTGQRVGAVAESPK